MKLRYFEQTDTLLIELKDAPSLRRVTSMRTPFSTSTAKATSARLRSSTPRSVLEFLTSPTNRLPLDGRRLRENLRMKPAVLAKARARLGQELLDSLDEFPPQEIDRLWLEEASRRAARIDAGEVELVSAEDVDRKARTLLR